MTRSWLDPDSMDAYLVPYRCCWKQSKLCFWFEHDLSDLPSPAEAGFAKAANRHPLFGSML